MLLKKVAKFFNISEISDFFIVFYTHAVPTVTLAKMVKFCFLFFLQIMNSHIQIKCNAQKASFVFSLFFLNLFAQKYFFSRFYQ